MHRYPTIADADNISEYSKKINEEAKVENLDDSLVRKSANFSQFSLVP